MTASSQKQFAAALLDPEQPVPPEIAATNGRASVKRFAVYRNNVTVGLVDALAARFPAAQRIVGEEFFRAAARVFVGAEPPRSPLLMFYGDGFPAFLERFEPAADVPYLADVSRIEAARTRAFHAEDAAPADPKRLQTQDESRLGDLRAVRHPATGIVPSAYPIVTIWEMNSGVRALAEIEDWSGEDALVTRPRFDVQVCALPRGGAAFFSALFAGAPLADAAEAAAHHHADFDLATNLAVLISSGAAADIFIPGQERQP